MKLITPIGVNLCSLITVGIVSFAVERRVLAISPENVLVIYNDDQGPTGDGFQIANYYQQVRPGVHTAPLSGIDAILAGVHDENVSGQNYLDIIRPQVLSAIAAIPDTIEVIVTTKGMPLRIDAGLKPPGGPSTWERYSSLESELARIDSIDTLNKMGDQFFNASFPQIDSSLAGNPYYNNNGPFAHVGSGGFFNEDMRLAARLDGYSVNSVKSAIDRAQQVYIVPFGHHIIVDDTGFASIDQMTNALGPGHGLFEVITGLYPDDGVSNPVPVLYDNTNSAIVSSNRPVIGYVSHGTNDGFGFGLGDNYLGEFIDGQFQAGDIAFQLANGAVFHTHESFNAQSFDPANTQSDGLVADWLEVGGTAGLGHVAEPFNGHENVTNEDLFYQMLLPSAGAAAAPGESGFTFVEAAWNATRQLSFVNTVVGDPLMRFQAWLPGDTNMDGAVDFLDFFTLQGNWQQPGNMYAGDFTGDGFISQADFQILQNNWLMSETAAALTGGADPNEIVVLPILDPNTGWPELRANLMRPANLDGDIDVDEEDLVIWSASYGLDDGGDIDGDGDTDGFDFLLWQQQHFIYTLTADFDLNAQTGQYDLTIWEDSYARNRGGDADGDGDTSGLDFLAWQREAAISTVAVTSASVHVPEPPSLLLLCLWAIVLASRSRAIRRCHPSVC